MLFANKIRELREKNKLPQRLLAAELQIDTATYCKFERCERRAKREQIPLIAKLLKTTEKELLTLWLADQVIELVNKEKTVATAALEVAKNYSKTNITKQND